VIVAAAGSDANDAGQQHVVAVVVVRFDSKACCPPFPNRSMNPSVVCP